MDLLDILRSKIDSLEEGDHIPGLKAVLLHIETASGHLLRGQKQNEETAFTDSIYRTNQAFEGSLKEAYRVLASKDPERERPYDIEQYFEKNKVFRQRVLAQFTNYRTEWRNPSSHDYKLDFDENEAFLAIVSVSAFACLVLDQISESLSYNKTKLETETKHSDIKTRLSSYEGSILDLTVELLKEFSRQHWTGSNESARQTEAKIIGALSGFFASAAPNLEVRSEVKLTSNSSIDSRKFLRVDLIVSNKKEQVIIELKGSKQGYRSGLLQLEHYMRESNIPWGILYIYLYKSGELDINQHLLPKINGLILALTPSEWIR
ncbi:MAG: hypothetical protein V7K88_17925 [Nostoc sp.]|uniref:hypothetical protein n=1 Tax=Nostoc sp. TaxID=1180 RepID=UPI002FF611AB